MKEGLEKSMEWQLFEILEEKIDEAVKKIETLSQENMEIKQKVKEKEKIILSAQERIDVLEEEKEIIKGKVDGILKKISQALG